MQALWENRDNQGCQFRNVTSLSVKKLGTLLVTSGLLAH